MGSETLPSACYILSNESSIPSYSTINGYSKRERYSRISQLSDIRYSTLKLKTDKSEVKMLR